MAVVLTNPVAFLDVVQYEWFDEVQKLSLLIAVGRLYTLNYEETNPAPKLLLQIDDLPERLLYAKLSLDREVLALQESPTSVLVIDIQSRKRFSVETRLGSDSVIIDNGLIWSDHGGTSQDLIMVCTRGLELYKVSGRKGQCKLSRSISFPCFSFWYNIEHRMIMTANFNRLQRGKNGKESLLMNGFFLKIEKATMPTLELPPPDRIPTFELGPGVSSDSIYLVSLYGLLLALVQYTMENEDFMTVYSITKTSVDKIMTLSLGYIPKSLQVTTSDNLLFLHDAAQKHTLIFDIMRSPQKSTLSNTGVIDAIGKSTPMCFAWIGEMEAQGNQSIALKAPESSPGKANKKRPSVESLQSSSIRFQQSLLRLEQSGGRKRGGYVEVTNPLPAYPAYSTVIFQLHPTGWAYDKEQRTMWKMECNSYETGKLIVDIRERMLFLMRRGKMLQWHNPENTSEYTLRVINKHPDGLFAKYAVMRTIYDYVEGCSTTEVTMKVVFDSILTSYFNEYVKGKPYWDEKAADMDILNFFRITPMQRKMEQMAFGNTNGSMDSPSNSNKAPIRNTLRAMSLGLQRKGSISGVASSGGSSNNLVVLPDDSDVIDPLEPSATNTQSFLPDINVIGMKIRNHILRSSATKEDADFHIQASESIDDGWQRYGSQQFPTQVALEQRPLSTRRDERGELIITQVEMLSYVWIPLLLVEEVDYAHIIDLLSVYIAAMADLEIEVISAVNILHVTGLLHLGKVSDICSLLRLSFYSDSAELALILLQFSGLLEDELKSYSLALESSVRLRDMPETEFRHMLTNWKEHLQSQGLAMLWRSNAKVTAVKWLLTQSLLADAIDLCSGAMIANDEVLKPGSIAGSDFFISAISIIRKRGAPELVGADLKDEDAQVLYNLHAFLLRWDPSCLVPKSVSEIQSLSYFPWHLTSTCDLLGIGCFSSIIVCSFSTWLL